MNHGIVKWFDLEKGFGFIERENGSDVFIKISSITSSNTTPLKEGQNVNFEIVQGDRGPQATNVSAV